MVKKMPIVLVLLIVFLAISRAQAVSLTFFHPSTYDANTAAMDAALGTTGFQFEDFEDTILLPGLSYTIDGSQHAPVTFNSLPNVFIQNGTRPAEFWAGPGQLTNLHSNACANWDSGFCSETRDDRVTFNLAGGTTSVGIGLGGFQSINPPSPISPLTDHTLYINGTAVPGTLESLAGAAWVSDPWDRNVYLVMTLELGDALITSFGFANNIPGNVDIIEFDHLAIGATGPNPVPIPAAIWLFGTALIGLVGFGKRRKAA